MDQIVVLKTRQGLLDRARVGHANTTQEFAAKTFAPG